MYTKLPNLVIGFHGCDESVIQKIIEQRLPMDNSNNTYDWLGHGLYFWESNLTRAWQWAKDGRTGRGKKIKNPSVIGAVIDLGYCLNLTDSESIELLKIQYGVYLLKARRYIRMLGFRKKHTSKSALEIQTA